VRSVPYGEADVVVTLFTEHYGIVAAMARGARHFRKGAPRSLEPMHTLLVDLAESPSSDLLSIRAASIDTPRRLLTSDLARLDAAGLALRWVRVGLPPRTAEPEAWQAIIHLLDALDDASPPAPPSALSAAFGLRLLRILGYELTLDSCIACGRPCAPGRSAYVDPNRGGIVCRSCGGHGVLLPGDVRERLAAATASLSETVVLSDVATIRHLIDEVLRSHLGLSGSP